MFKKTSKKPPSRPPAAMKASARKPAAKKAASNGKSAPSEPSPSAAPTAADQEGSLKHVLLGWYGVIGLMLSYVLPFRPPFVETYAKDYWRHALGSLLLVLALVASAVGAALYLFDANDFKAQIVDYVRAHKQRDLVIDGDIHVAFFPKLGLDTGRMSLSQRNSARKFASVDNARLYVAWWPLLRRQLQVERVVLDGLHANVVRHKDGSTNFDDLLTAADRLGDVRFEVERLRVLSSSVHVDDELRGTTLSLHDLEIETGRLADAASGEVKAGFRLESNQPRVDARVELDGHLQYDRAAQRYEMSDLHARVQGEAVGLADLGLDLRGALTAQPGAGQWQLANLQASLQGRLAQRAVEARLSAASVKADRQFWRAGNVALALRLPEGQEASIDVPALEADVRYLRLPKATASVGWQREGRALQAQFSSPVQVDFNEGELALGAVTGQWSLVHPLLAGKLQAAASGRLQLRWPAQELRAELSTQIDDSQFSGTVQVQDFRTPAYAVEVAVNTLDLDRHLVPDWPARLRAALQTLDPAAWRDLNLRLRLQADALTAAKLSLQRFAAEARAADGALQLESARAQLYGGAWQASASLSGADRPQLALRQKLSGVQLDALLADLLPSETRIAGRGNLACELQAEGRGWDALRRSLKGSASVSLSHGALAGLQLGDALLAGKELLGLPGAERSDTLRFTENTAFTDLRATFEIAQGSAHSTDLLLRTPLLSARGEIELGLDAGDVDANWVTTVAGGLRRSTAGELADLAGIRVPARLSGPWSSAAVVYQLGRASGGTIARLARANQARVASAGSTAAKPAGAK